MTLSVMDRADIPDTAVVADMPSGLRVVEAVPVQPLTAGRELHRVVSPVLGEDVLERQLTVAAVRTESDGVVSLRLVSPDGDSLPEWEPGAHVDLVLTDDLLRQYSLCGDPADAYSWQVAVLDEPGLRELLGG